MDETNPTTLRFGRRIGESYRGADYAASIEATALRVGSFARSLAIAVVAVSLIAAYLLVHWFHNNGVPT